MIGKLDFGLTSLEPPLEEETRGSMELADHLCFLSVLVIRRLHFGLNSSFLIEKAD